MGGRLCREEVREEKKRSPPRDSLTSAEKIKRFIVKQFGYNVLSLTRRGLKEVPDELWELPELEKLNLSLNNLKTVPPQLSLLSNLVALNLWGNQKTAHGLWCSAPPEDSQDRCVLVDQQVMKTLRETLKHQSSS